MNYEENIHTLYRKMSDYSGVKLINQIVNIKDVEQNVRTIIKQKISSVCEYIKIRLNRKIKRLA